LFIVFAEHSLPEQRVKLLSGGLQTKAYLVQHDVLVRVLQSPFALDCLIGTLSVFDGVVISIKRTADAPTLIESWYLTTSDAYASRV